MDATAFNLAFNRSCSSNSTTSSALSYEASSSSSSSGSSSPPTSSNSSTTEIPKLKQSSRSRSSSIYTLGARSSSPVSNHRASYSLDSPPSPTIFATRTAHIVHERYPTSHVLVVGYDPPPGSMQLEGTKDSEGHRSEETEAFEHVYHYTNKGDHAFSVYVFEQGRFSIDPGGQDGFASLFFWVLNEDVGI